MADTTSNNKELANEQQISENNSNEAHNSQPSTTTNEPEKITDTIPSGLNVSETSDESTTSNIHNKSEETMGMNIASNSDNQKGSALPSTSTDPDTSNGITNEPISSESDQSQKEAEINVGFDGKQTEVPVDSNPSNNLDEVKSNNDANVTSDNNELKETEKVDTSTSSNDATIMDDSDSSDDQNKNGRRKNDESPSDQYNQNKIHKPEIIPPSDEFGRSTALNIGYYLDEKDLLESVFDNATNKKLIDRLLGCVYGQALGDAYGLSTEFEDQLRVERNYPNKKKIIPFPNYILTGHNRRWPRGDWTDDTDQWILILDTLVNYNGDEKVFAKKLASWIQNGYPELGDHGGMGLGANVSQVVHSPNYINDPLKASQEVWERSKRQAAPNGAVMRCSASAFVHFNDPEKVISTATLMCKTTHFDPRCIASCVAVCLAITYLLREEVENDDIESLIKRVQDETVKIIGDSFSEEHRESFLWHTDERELEELELDEPNSIGYTYKCLASGFYGLRSIRPFEETLNDLIRYGGDADTNGAVCGTMYGARYGYRKLPYDWLRKMPNKKWLDLKIIQWLGKLNLIKNEDMEINL